MYENQPPRSGKPSETDRPIRFYEVLLFILKDLLGRGDDGGRGDRENRRLRAIGKLARRGRSVPDVVPYPGNPLRLVVRNQLVVHLESPLSEEKAQLFVAGANVDKKGERRSVRVRVRRVCHCNPNLVLLESSTGRVEDEVHLLAGDLELRYSPDTDSTPPPIRTSSANDVHYSPDTDSTPPPIRTSSGGGIGTPGGGLPASFDAQLRRIQQQAPELASLPGVAIMDTGIDFSYPNTVALPILYTGGSPLCDTVEPDYIGWDFVHDQNDPYDDNDRNKHGSRIAAIINQAARGQVQILPLKVIDSEGIGLLFNILCGFEYLLSERLRGRVSLINASWGFYSHQPDGLPDPLLTNYVQKLKDAGIWLINAAGNEGDIRANQTVDLGDSPRYPANYSVDHTNVVTVTTVRNPPAATAGVSGVSVVENYSNRFVNVGIGAGPDGKFKEPLDDGNFPSVKGSSYATPYVCGLALQQPQKPLPPTTAGPAAFVQNLPDETGNGSLMPRIVGGAIVIVETT